MFTISTNHLGYLVLVINLQDMKERIKFLEQSGEKHDHIVIATQKRFSSFNIVAGQTPSGRTIVRSVNNFDKPDFPDALKACDVDDLRNKLNNDPELVKFFRCVTPSPILISDEIKGQITGKTNAPSPEKVQG